MRIPRGWLLVLLGLAAWGAFALLVAGVWFVLSLVAG